MKLLTINQKVTSMKLILCILVTFISLTLSAKDITSANCPGVQGLKVFTNYTADGIALPRKLKTNLFNSFDDDHNFNHLMVDVSKFKSGNVEVIFEVLNKKNEPIKKVLLNKWTKDKDFPQQRILKIPVSKIILNNLSEPHDNYINLTKEQKANTNMSTIPFNGKFYISQKNKPAFCIFDFKYASKHQ